MLQSDFISILSMGSERVVADLAVEALEKNPAAIRALVDLCFIEKYPMAMRAARAFQLYCEKHPDEFYPFLEECTEKMIQSKIDGVRRNFLKIISEFIDISRLQDPGKLLNACFNWLQDPGEKPALRIHAMEIVFKLGETEPEILNELRASLEMIGPESEISLRNHSAKMLIRLGKPNSGRR
jgi:hypothetical protein